MIIVTGGAGFIGSNIVWHLNQKGIDDILIVDNIAATKKHLNLNNLKFADYIHKDDFLNRLDEFNDVEAVFHQGACSSTTETDGNYMLRNNYEYTKQVLAACVKWKCNLIYASSASVYGSREEGFIENLGDEDPLNVYAFSKHLFDNYLRRIKQEDLGISVTGLRYFNVYGPQENHKDSMASVPFHLFNQLKKGEKMKLFEGSDGFLRDFIHIDDVARVCIHFYENPTSGIFNCGTGKARSFLDIANCFKAMDSNAELEYIPFPEKLEGKYQKHTEADLTALRAAGYKHPFLSLEEGVSKYYKTLSETGGYLQRE